VLAALVAVFAGERVVSGVPLMRLALSGGGALVLVGATLWRALAWRGNSGDARAVERIFLLSYLGCTLAVLFFLLASGLGTRLGIVSAEPGASASARTALLVIGAVLLCASLLPAIAARWAAGPEYSAGSATASVDRLRISQVATAALTIGLAVPFLVLTGYVAKERDKSLDLSYFKTSSPGTASEELVESLGTPLEVLLFFPPTSDVTDQLRGYFRTLGEGGRSVQVEEYDRVVSPQEAQENGVVSDGIIVLKSGEKRERIPLPVRLAEARLQLRTLDTKVQEALMRLSREERTVYMTVGHGELNDQESARATDTLSISSSTFAIESLLQYLNYTYRQLGVRTGLANEVPQDAAMVLVLGPRRPFLEPELRTLERYLARGGSVFFALEPDSDFELGPLERLGVRFDKTPLADDQNYILFRQNISDRRLLHTNNVFSHASTATAAEAGIGDGTLFWGAGSIRPLSDDAPGITVIARSMLTAFADSSRDFQPGPTEERLQFPLAVAIEKPAPVIGENGEGRALIYADADLFTDEVVQSIGLNGALLADGIRWLGHEEELAGETSSEADVPIVHTRRENVAWFYSTILGAPSLVLALGLLGVRRRRSRQTERTA
jgi:hypothetical protein